MVSPQAVLKVLARPKYSVPLYKAKSGFSSLTGEGLTFETVSTTSQCYMIYSEFFNLIYL